MIHELNLSTLANLGAASNTLMRSLVSQEFLA